MNMSFAGRDIAKVTDHPKIGIDSREYDRIARDFEYYSNLFPNIKYKSSFGDMHKREFRTLNVTKTASRWLASIIFN
ncbi:hypothetical protein IGI53_001064 [Enterococcus sp. DIV0788_1]